MNFIAALLIVTAAALVCCQASSGDSKIADVYQDPPYKKSVDQVDSHRYAAMLGKRTSMGRFYDTPDFIPVAPESLGYNEDKAERNEALLYVIRKLVNRAYDPMDKK